MSTDVALKIHRANLYQKIDGRPLCEFKENPKGQLWLSGHTRIVNGRAFKNLVKLCIGKLATMENATRGRDIEKKCRHCLRVNESMQHVIQHCHFTHFARMQSHDARRKVLRCYGSQSSQPVREVQPVSNTSMSQTEKNESG